jgi:hypothetical protein
VAAVLLPGGGSHIYQLYRLLVEVGYEGRVAVSQGGADAAFESGDEGYHRSLVGMRVETPSGMR